MEGSKEKSIYNSKGVLKTPIYNKELNHLQEELVKLQYWIKEKKK